VNLLDVLRLGPEPLVAVNPDPRRLRVALIVPTFPRGSGGHGTIAHLVRGLEARGHACSLWLLDAEREHAPGASPETARRFTEYFGAIQGPIHTTSAEWTGADVVVATGWQTVPSVLRLPSAGARAYLVQDHEPEFYATSAERMWASWTYRQGLHCIAASPWLVDVLAGEYGVAATGFDLAVDHDRYRILAEPRRSDRVLFYARHGTPRRGVALGLLALEELHRRRPGVDIALFGADRAIDARFPHVDLGTQSPEDLARTYASATVGLVLSLTNPSLLPQEMMACGLPCVDVAGDPMLATFGATGPVALADPHPLALADAIEVLLDDDAAHSRRVRDGLAWVESRTWAAAAAQVEAGLSEALRTAQPD
jgi:glycosyltransferase involved in cell wall biosynthesis